MKAWSSAQEAFYGEELWPTVLAGLERTEAETILRISKKPYEDNFVFSTHVRLQKRLPADNELDYFLDLASLAPVIALDVGSNDKVLDLCAAPGGKSLLIASRMDDINSRGLLLMNELSADRMARLKRNVTNFLTDPQDPKFQFAKVDATKSITGLARFAPFNRILVDAPCSSDRHRLRKGLLTDWKPSTNKSTIKTQISLVQAGIELMKDKIGCLVYSTCALSNGENDDVINKVLSKRTDLRSDKVGAEHLLISSLSGTMKVKIANLHDKIDAEEGIVIRRTVHGHLILPEPNNNYAGPIYFARLIFCATGDTPVGFLG